MNTNILGQEMALRATKVPRSFVARQTAIWKQRRDYIYGEMLAMGFDLWEAGGSVLCSTKDKNTPGAWSRIYITITTSSSTTALGLALPGEFAFPTCSSSERSKIKEGLSRIAKYLKGKERLLA